MHVNLSNHMPLGILKTNRFETHPTNVASGFRLGATTTHLSPMFLKTLQPQDGVHTRDAQAMPLCEVPDVRLSRVGHEVIPDLRLDSIRNWSRRLERRVQGEWLHESQPFTRRHVHM